MCDFEKGFILCICSDKELATPAKEREYTWSLSKYLGLNTNTIIGKYKLPVSSLEKGLTVEFLEKELNHRNCFDFDYIPAEGDNLSISETHSNQRIEFIFTNKKWTEGHYPVFDHVCEEVNNGVLKSNT